MLQPLSLADIEMDIVTDLAAPLAPSERGAFLEAFAAELQRHPVDALGPGMLHRLGRDLQRQFLKNDQLAVGTKGVGKYSRPHALLNRAVRA